MYVRLNRSDTWHWCKNCSKYPQGSDVVKSRNKPNSGELCNECKSKDSNNNCKR